LLGCSATPRRVYMKPVMTCRWRTVHTYACTCKVRVYVHSPWPANSCSVMRACHALSPAASATMRHGAQPTASQHGPVTSFTRPHISCQDSNSIDSHSTARDDRQTRQAPAAPAAALLTTNDPIFPTRLFHHFRKHVRAMVSNAALPPPP